jgi:hemoglobin
MTNSSKTIYEQVGGTETFLKLVEIFYAKVEADPELRAMFPEDLEPGKRWQFLFLQQFFGGPSDYAEERGHPRLRMRHMPFPIDQKSRDSWLQYMLEAIDELNIQDPARTTMRDYFEQGSSFMINRYQPDEE